MKMFFHWNITGAIVANTFAIDTLFTRIIFTIATLETLLTDALEQSFTIFTLGRPETVQLIDWSSQVEIEPVWGISVNDKWMGHSGPGVDNPINLNGPSGHADTCTLKSMLVASSWSQMHYLYLRLTGTWQTSDAGTSIHCGICISSAKTWRWTLSASVGHRDHEPVLTLNLA